MLTYTSRRNLTGTLCGDSSSANLTVMDTLLAEADREIMTMKPWSFRQSSITFSTVASQQFYNLPNSTSINDVTVTIGSIKYTPTEIKDRDEWDRINQATNVTSNIPNYFYLYGLQIGFYPLPSSATANAVTVNFSQGQKDLSIADYTAGTITSATNGSTAITGSGTSWTSQMVGRFIRITDSSTSNTGDGFWYKISSVGSAITITLSSAYQGNSIAAGAASYIIGQVSIIPEEFQMLPVHRAVQQYFTFIQPEPIRAKSAADLYLQGLKRMQMELGSTSM